MKKFFKWSILVVAVLYIGLVVYRAFVIKDEMKTAEQVAKIHATKLTLADVMGEHLPLEPESPDATIEGVDANTNGIRDDVELAIFREYPDSAKTRAVLLQYALALQMEVTQSQLNQDIAIAAIQEESRAYLCVGQILSREDMDKYMSNSDELRSFVKDLQLDTKERKETRARFYENIGSHESLERKCDIDYSTLPN